MLRELLPEDKLKLQELERDVTAVECGQKDPADVYLGLREMEGRLQALEALAEKENPGARNEQREDARRRIQHLKNTAGHIRTSLDTIVHRKNRTLIEEQEREKLLGSVQRRGGRGDRESDVELAVQEGSSLDRSNNMVNELIMSGRGTLDELLENRETLKSVQRSVMDIANYLGVSNTVMRLAERREYVDAWIVGIGMVVVLLVLFGVWHYTG